ncbi:hemolysin family protein [Corynebacterium nasicanis]
MQWYVALPVTVLVIVLSAFFVVIEFSLLAARRNRLEDTAETSASSRAALRSLNELTLMLAGAQLGITAATFALGAITKPWIHQLLEPAFGALPGAAAYAVSFAVSLFIVTFLHLVIGEMAPKSWALAHPETAVRVIAAPARVFITLFRPLLQWINTMANALVRRAGEVPVERAAAKGYDAATLHHLVEHSRDTGALDDMSATQITGLIALESISVAEAITPREPLPATATVADVRARSRELRSMRVLIDAPASTPHLVHVRDTLLADPAEPADTYSRPALLLPQTTTLAEALNLMRGNHEQVAVVVPEDGIADSPGEVVGVITWDDILTRLWPSIEEEIDRVSRG